ncbi:MULTISPECIES: meiotically up-regulated 80 protein [Enterobacter]|nr:meiotically up-regulated 80 protein [Enterobacter sp. HK169]
MALVHQLQQIIANENLTPAELVGYAKIVRDNYGRLYDISNPKI